jgi:hypothetical protein
VTWPADLDGAGKAEVPALARQSRIAAALQIRDRLALSLGDAKGVVMHISLDDDVCVRCGNPVAKGETVCTNCNGVNLNW